MFKYFSVHLFVIAVVLTCFVFIYQVKMAWSDALEKADEQHAVIMEEMESKSKERYQIMGIVKNKIIKQESVVYVDSILPITYSHESHAKIYTITVEGEELAMNEDDWKSVKEDMEIVVVYNGMNQIVDYDVTYEK
ncbi:hypothetical protein [Paenibacillus agilis]|uniref:DUF3221 domain-containing protein n=1 Tax=Paenibacillus agilis TaxID=3020863 RepID=A0A559ID82_9BACL|nr:hypothetical protein [Paenibacillus agilis]TVX85595.1 hypothetical protein FPZ44_24890 [Paenibacillus agilis]